MDFNPQIPDSRDPGLPNIRPIQDIPANQSGATILSTLSSGLGDAVNVVDSAIKSSIREKANAGVDPQREQFTAGLEKIKAQLNNDQSVVPAPVQTVVGSTTGKSLLDANAQADEDDIPPGLDSGIDRIRQLAAAKAAGSAKLNDTQYAMETLSVAKNLRAQYGTGYRDYIDSEVSKASGLPVANSYYQNLMLDINRQLTQQGKVKDDVLTMMEKNSDVPNMGQYYQKYNAGDPTITKTMIFQKVADWNNLRTQQTIDAANRSASTDDVKTKQTTETAALTRDASRTVDLYMKDIANLSGMPGLGATMQYFQDVQAGKYPEATDQDVHQRVYQLQAYRQGIYAQLKGRSASSDPIIGSDESEKVLSAALQPLDNMIKLANDKDASPAFYHQKMVEAVGNQDVYDWLVNKDRGALSRQFMTGRKVLGEQYFPDWLRSTLSQGMDKPIQDAFNQIGLNSIAPITDTRGTPLPRTMIEDVQHVKGTTIPPDSGIHGKITGLVNTLTEPKASAEAKDNIINYAFDPKNRALLDEFKMDYKDPVTGQVVQGKYSAFNILSAPKITQAVAESAKAKPENYQKYESTLGSQFGELYRSDIQTLNKILEKPYLNAHFSFNSDSNQFGLVDNNNRPIVKNERALGIQQPNQVYLNGMLDVLDRVNGGLRNLAYVHKMNPAGEGDTPQYLLQTLQTVNHGRFGYDDKTPFGGATEGMLKSIIKSQAPEMTPQELHDKVMKFAPSGNNSVAEFTRNPTGSRSDLPPVRPDLAPYQNRRVIQGNLSDQPIDAPIRTYR